MLVNIIQDFFVEDRRWKVGDNPDVPKEVALRWIADGKATLDADGRRNDGSAVPGDGKTGLNVDAANAVTLRPAGLLLAGAGAANATKLVAVSSPVPFAAVQIAYQHLGGGGDCTGLKACVAATDDPGPMDYSLGGSSAELKKIVTPKRGGTEYNTLSANGWQAVTWGGSASASIVDPGAGLVALATSDIIPVSAVQAPDGLYYALIRVYDGTGPYTRSGYVGLVTGTQYGDDAAPWRLVSMFRGGDHVTDPSGWTTGVTPSFAEMALCPIVIRLIGAVSPAASVMVVGDSRSDAVSEPSPVPQYRATNFLMAQTLRARGKTVGLMRSGFGGATSAQYLHHATNMLGIAAPTAALYYVYTVNDGVPTQSNIDAAKKRARTFVGLARDAGTQVVLVTSWPRTGLTAAQLALLRGLDDWAAASGVPYVSPLAVLGTASGDWGVWRYNDDHGTQAAYQRMADEFADKLISLGYV